MIRRATMLLLVAPFLARAQGVPTVDPAGREPPTPPLGSPPAGSVTGVPGGVYGVDQPPPPGPEIRVIVPPGGQVEGTKEKEPEGLYLGGIARPTGPAPETVPEAHKVQPGDTLWDICATYFADPYLWPKVWALNPTITNPHWIYPGDLIRLRPPGTGQAAAPADTAPAPALGPAITPPAHLRRVAYVSLADLKTSAEVVGSPIERVMLATGDEIYLTYPDGQPPQVGATYSIYSPTKDVKHPETKKKVGSYVQILGEARILDVKKGKNALAVITDVTDEGVIERGNRVGTLKTQFQAVRAVPADKSVEAVIVAILHMDELVGEGALVVIDKGRRDGLAIGNPMLAVRRGDAYMKTRDFPAGMDDRRYPDKYLGDVMLVDVAEGHALGFTMRTDKEILIGDHLVMRAAAK